MTTRTEFFRWSFGAKLYVLTRPSDWTSTPIYGIANPNDGGQYQFDGLDYALSYEVFIEETPDTPANTDLAVGEFFGPQGAVIEGGIGSGPLQLTVEVKDSLGAGIANAVVSMVGTNYRAVTDAYGDVIFNLQSGTYDVRVLPPSKYSAPDDQQINLAADSTLSFTLQGVPAVEAPGWLG